MQFLSFIFLLSFLGGCQFSEPSGLIKPYAEQLASRNEKIEFTGQFQYQLKNCEGPFATVYNDSSHASHSLTITVDRSRVELIRHDKKSSEPKLIGNWNSNNQTLFISNVGKNWGIAEIEDWRNSVGVMELKQDEISGRITNINLSTKGTFCEAELKFTGASL